MSLSRSATAVALSIVGVVLAVVLLLEHHGESLGGVEAVCGAGAANGCETVARSAYSTVAGLPLAALGLFFYLSIASLLGLATLAGGETLAAAVQATGYLVALALAADVVLLGLQAIIIKAFCRLCLGTYVVNAALLFVLFPWVRSKAASVGALLRGEGRIVATGWVLASVGIAAAVVSWNLTLSYRQEKRGANLLGSPSSPGEGSSVQKAEAEVARLQEILDDPQKREQYVADRSIKQFVEAKPQTFDLSQAPFSGPANAPIQVVEYSDYLCPYCRGLAAGFKDYLTKSGDRVAIHYKNYPLDKACNSRLQGTVHEGACWLALGAICAQQLGNFIPYQEKAYQTPERATSRDDAIRLGVEVGLQAAAMGACIDRPSTKDRLSDEITEAERSGVKATPTVFINGKYLPRLNDFLIAVERETTRLGLPPARPPAPLR